ncbi:hypothetical protein E4Q23_19445 [Candidatus Accumulibacter phosphatis]|uniref:Uncharacterized protein n=1 Tax=Candidatus Accumulibacter phosphatis TaxID=327160 RepID=A0ABX1U3P4_9PROT|nr:hypothetical protein [Candidatus Accumulibacter phosphatis]NMQ29749.1 hypothetical protein [Candidatus Accumulibacter phosphatis]
MKGLFGAAEATIEVESSSLLVKMRNRLQKPPRSLSEAEATRIVEDVAIVGLTRLGRAFESLKGKHIDNVLNLRNEIDGLFHEVFVAKGSGTDDAVRKALDARLPRIKQLYAELDTAIQDATQPLAKLKLVEEDAALRAKVEDIPAGKTSAKERKIEADQAREMGRRTDRLRRKGFRKYNDGFKVKFADGAETVLKVKNGRYVAEIWDQGVGKGSPRRFEEFTVSIDPYKTDFRTTSVLQRNHVVQDSLMKKLFGPFGYDSDAVPTIWMRDSRTDSPHYKVTGQQRAYKTGSGSVIDDAAKRASQLKSKKVSAIPPNKLTLAEMQRMGVEQMKSVGCPPEAIVAYLKHFDRVFEAGVYQRLKATLSESDVASLLGDWKPGGIGIGTP